MDSRVSSKLKLWNNSQTISPSLLVLLAMSVRRAQLELDSTVRILSRS